MIIEGDVSRIDGVGENPSGGEVDTCDREGEDEKSELP